MASYESVIQDINANRFRPVYFFQGEEPFFIDQLMNSLEDKVVPAEQKSFNQHVFYGKEASFEQVVSAARSFPMMGERQLVLVREAQEMGGWKKEADQKLLLQYIDNPTPSTVLAFGYKYKDLDKKTILGKRIEKQAETVKSKRIYDNKVPSWIQSYVKAQGVAIKQDACMLLAENTGNELQKLVNELDKVMINLEGRKEITKDHIYRFAGINKEYNVFEFQKVIGMRNYTKALKMAYFFADNARNHPLIRILTMLLASFGKLLLVHYGKRDGV
jgi:DNA polymerase-3 subunit delta